MNMKFLDEAWTEGERPRLWADVPVLDKEHCPTSVRNTRALSLWRRRTMLGRWAGRKRNAPTLRFSFLGWNAECLSLFARNPQPSRTLCPSVFNFLLDRARLSLSLSTISSRIPHSPFPSELSVSNVPHRVQPPLTRCPPPCRSQSINFPTL